MMIWLFSGHGRRRRAEDRNSTEYTKFKENLEYTVIMPGEYESAVKFDDSVEGCKSFVMISGLLAGLLALSTIIVSSSPNIP
jgi:hypothetical protein